jgi:transposase
MIKLQVIGLDLAKNVFQAHGIDGSGQVRLKRKLRRDEIIDFFATLEPTLIGMEACATAHHWARELSALGHEVRLMPPQFVKPYVKSQKNDASDAEAICEAVQRPTMRFVPIKTVDQQAALMLHRTREFLIRQRTSLISAIRAHFAEFGIIAASRIPNVDRLLELLAVRGEQLPVLVKQMLGVLADQLCDVAERVRTVEGELLAWHRSNEVSCRLATIPGIGPITASALATSVVDAAQFASGRQLAAWLGLVPQQRSSGGKERLGKISKRGDGYIRQLLIHGARSVVSWRRRSTAVKDVWLVGLLLRRPFNVATVALANKSARIAWAVMTTGNRYDPRLARAA